MKRFVFLLLPAFGLGLADETKKFCGGIYHTPCGPGEVCVDDVADGCNPGQGGFDCPAHCISKVDWEANPVPTVIAW